jgi:hypothetical protein
MLLHYFFGFTRGGVKTFCPAALYHGYLYLKLDIKVKKAGIRKTKNP